MKAHAETEGDVAKRRGDSYSTLKYKIYKVVETRVTVKLNYLSETQIGPLKRKRPWFTHISQRLLYASGLDTLVAFLSQLSCSEMNTDEDHDNAIWLWQSLFIKPLFWDVQIHVSLPFWFGLYKFIYFRICTQLATKTEKWINIDNYIAVTALMLPAKYSLPLVSAATWQQHRHATRWAQTAFVQTSTFPSLPSS